MRFALRNKEKLVNSFGADFYQLLIDSLKHYSSTHEDFNSYQYAAGSQHTYMMIDVESVHPRSEITFQFVITGIMYDVIHVAYFSSYG